MLYTTQGRIVDFTVPQVMGILNVTPDSFYDGGLHLHANAIRAKVEQMLVEGATIIDIGAASSRPGATEITQEEEWERLAVGLGVLLEYRDQVLISVDTYRSEIAEKVLDLGVHIINDISGGEMDELMLNVVSRYQCIYVCMHMQGSPNSMQVNPTYGDVLMEILQYFAKKIFTLRQHGIEQVLIDPGFGFGKSLSHNYTLLDKLNTFAILEKPVLVGMSRKSMFYNILETSAENSLSATLGGQMVALMHGASVLRVHDVAEASQIVKVFNYMTNNRKI